MSRFDWRSKRFRLGLLAVLAGVIIIVAAVYFLLGIPLRNAREEWMAGKSMDAVETLRPWSKLHLRSGDFDLEMAAAYLTAGSPHQAAPYLDALSRHSPFFFPEIRKWEVGEKLLAEGRYDSFLQYDRAVRERFEPEATKLYRAAAALGTDKLATAKEVFDGIEESKVDPTKYAALKKSIDDRANGSYPMVFDREGRPIAIWQMRNRDLVTIDTQFSPLIDRSGGNQTIETALSRIGGGSTFNTTLDPAVQNAALYALGGFRGSMVVIDVKRNEILAVASNPGTGAPANIAFEGFYEPGSVIKPLTALAAIDHGVDLGKIFPFQCGGFLTIDGKMFYDWAKHEKVENLNEATAVSCNGAYGEIGMQLGRDELLQFLHQAGFGANVTLGILKVPLGRIVGPIESKYDVANLAIGLGHERINALHLAMMAEMIASEGKLRVPTLFTARRNVLGEPMPLPASVPPRQIASEGADARVEQAMEAVVVNPRGTGRRAAVSGVPIAMKTGTAGHREPGYSALIMAFAPAGDPRIAIGMIAENAGPAEIAGAKIAHDFFSQMAPRLETSGE
ncbi:MAG: penicillin-binding transpeptidase domain-containing protein [Thermoanaerobaculia bacterium]